ncbi:ABC transporter ATP-binding protein [Rosenbergiella sp. S61]|uniref:ABC transporter ATP-binding protein n=1 Tax=Rosenbergiella gaditana TaxID=2726987 RepID=A0ABS5SY63_9GAMM|nr:ABC transporter ATP-binding protein [Rosenbergiella gaditana]MBT0725045.1 ABC transporter ATP-binding protein [Rosenbergiella gaditana]
MSSNDIAINVKNVKKCYNIYHSPRDRLKQFVLPKFQYLVGKESKNYYDEFWALDDISFSVKKGESAGIIGRNGSGKSTLLQLITGTLTPTSGEIYTHGRIAALLELGSGFNPEFTGIENIYLNGAVLGLSRQEIDNKFDAIAGFADIGSHLKQPVKTYSSGMMVRLAFAVQVQLEPEILIVDEALAVGDALFQKRCFQQIEKLTSDGVTLLFVSHDQESVRTLTNKSILLDRGKQLNVGLSSEILLEYRRLLHKEESEYFSKLAQDLASKKEIDNIATNKEEPSVIPDISNNEKNDNKNQSRTDKLSFGEGDAEIESVKILNSNGEFSNAFNPGDKIKIRIHCHIKRNISKLNVGIRIRNKEGVKIYSWGTLNQDMAIRYNNSDCTQFWKRKFSAGERFFVDLDFICNLGTNLYEVQAAVSLEETPNYLSQRILHWQDEAAFFHVNVVRDEYFFGGVIDLKMNASW